MEMLIIEKQALDELIYKLELLKRKLDGLYTSSGVDPEEWLDNQQVCQRLDISKRALQNLRASGLLPFSQTGAKMKYKPADVEKIFLMGYKKDA